MCGPYATIQIFLFQVKKLLGQLKLIHEVGKKKNKCIWRYGVLPNITLKGSKEDNAWVGNLATISLQDIWD